MENRADEDVLPLIKTARAERTVDELRGTPLEAQMHNAKSRLQNEGCRVFFFQERSSCADGYTGVCMSDDDACVSVIIIIIIIVRAIYNSVCEERTLWEELNKSTSPVGVGLILIVRHPEDPAWHILDGHDESDDHMVPLKQPHRGSIIMMMAACLGLSGARMELCQPWNFN